MGWDVEKWKQSDLDAKRQGLKQAYAENGSEFGTFEDFLIWRVSVWYGAHHAWYRMAQWYRWSFYAVCLVCGMLLGILWRS